MRPHGCDRLLSRGAGTEEYCRLLVGVVLATVVASVWTVADRRAPRGRWVEDALRVLLRYSIALGLASYAMSKLMPPQFGELGPTSLEMHVGELAPAALLWRFMEASQAYSLFGGVAEIVAVVLLCFRRTALLGALVCIPVMVNVAMMNLCYGVPVKLFSCSIVVSASVLALLDVRRLADVLVLHRAIPAAPPAPPFRSPRLDQVRWAVKAILVGGVLLSSFVEIRHLIDARQAEHTSPLYGSWRVTSFVRDGEELATTGDATRWRRMAYEGGRALVRLEDDTLLWCAASEAGDAHTLDWRCRPGGDDGRRGELRWSRDGEGLRMEGTFDGAPVSLALSRVDEGKMTLRSARFRWIADTE